MQKVCERMNEWSGTKCSGMSERESCLFATFLEGAFPGTRRMYRAEAVRSTAGANGKKDPLFSGTVL
ncbi:MAG: hypothetical protein IJ688_09380 [Treponema sp.]|nr:hypothetical protein [Treponema sp.]